MEVDELGFHRPAKIRDTGGSRHEETLFPCSYVVGGWGASLRAVAFAVAPLYKILFSKLG